MIREEEVSMSEPAHTLDYDGRDWPAPGEWTYQDYLRLPRRPDDGRRFEVIRGVLYVTATPTFPHQYAVGEIFSVLRDFGRRHGLGLALVAPFNIRLPERIGDPMAPDVMFFRKGNEPRDDGSDFQGVPDLVVEVLSPSTRRRDRTVKLEAYRDAGVAEYWIADPRARTVEVFGFSDDRTSYVEIGRYAKEDEVISVLLPGLRVPVAEIFWPG
jgi:Uma2 family endonuclease